MLELLGAVEPGRVRDVFGALAHADFEKHEFTDGADFRNFRFPGDAQFTGAQFSGGDARFEDAQFSGGHAWFEDAQFSGGDAWFTGAQFGGESAELDGAQFSGGHAAFWGAQFSGGHAWFTGAQFSGGDAWFEGAQFSGGDAAFDGAQFSGGYAAFDGAQFSGGRAAFDGAQFSGGPAWFDGARFSGGHAAFEGAQFSGGDASFAGAQFARATYFKKIQSTFIRRLPVPDEINQRLREAPMVQFHHRADFTQATFEDGADFDGAVFHDSAIFRLKELRNVLSLADVRFARAPDFIGVAFPEPPRLDNARIEPPLRHDHTFDDKRPDPRLAGSPRWHRLFGTFAVARDGDEHARFRKLRSMAAQANDHENEIKFNAHEIASRRFWVDRPWSDAGRFWLGWLYSKLSDYGQSVKRPFLAWSALVGMFAVVYWGLSGAPAAPPTRTPIAYPPAFELDPALLKRVEPARTGGCHPSYEEARTREVKDASGQSRRTETYQPTRAVYEAFILSFRNGLIFDRSDVARRMYGCLYGIQDKGGQDYPTIPPAVTVLSTVQGFISFVLFFLFGLGIRNMFRMR